MLALRLFALFLLISTALPVSAQEDLLHRTEMKPSPAGSPATSPESTTSALTAPQSSPSATTAPPLTDVLFKNLKARSIGPAVMGGRVSDIALDPHNPFYLLRWAGAWRRIQNRAQRRDIRPNFRQAAGSLDRRRRGRAF
jgi:hypothetical protein